MEVRSVGPGTVAFVGDREGYGQLLVINHPEGLQTRYANLSDISVSTGQAVSETTVIGSVGQTMRDRLNQKVLLPICILRCGLTLLRVGSPKTLANTCQLWNYDRRLFCAAS